MELPHCSSYIWWHSVCSNCLMPNSGIECHRSTLTLPSYSLNTSILRPWSTMECSEPAAWAMNQSLLVASSLKVIPRTLNLQEAVHQDGSVIGCHQCITSHSGSVPASPDIRATLLALSHMHTIHHLHPCPTTAMTNNTHAPTGDYLAHLPWTALALMRSSSDVYGNSTTTPVFADIAWTEQCAQIKIQLQPGIVYM